MEIREQHDGPPSWVKPFIQDLFRYANEYIDTVHLLEDGTIRFELITHESNEARRITDEVVSPLAQKDSVSISGLMRAGNQYAFVATQRGASESARHFQTQEDRRVAIERVIDEITTSAMAGPYAAPMPGGASGLKKSRKKKKHLPTIKFPKPKIGRGFRPTGGVPRVRGRG